MNSIVSIDLPRTLINQLDTLIFPPQKNKKLNGAVHDLVSDAEIEQTEAM